MTMQTEWRSWLRRGIAAIILLLLLATPIFNWQLGAFFWLWAMLYYVFQELFSGGRRRAQRNGSESDTADEEGGNS